MDITFEKINNNISDIVDEFEQLLVAGNYDEAKDAVDKIITILDDDATTNIGLANPGSTDTKFHELYNALIYKVENRPGGTPVAGTGSIDYNALKSHLTSVTTRLFKTTEVRNKLIEKENDLGRDVFRDALAQGLAESTAVKQRLENNKLKYEFINNELFFDGSGADRRDKIQDGKMIAEELQVIHDDIIEMYRMLSSISMSTDLDRIDEKEEEIKTKITAVGTKIDITSLGNIDTFLESPRADSKILILKDAILKTEYEAILQKIDDAKNGRINFNGTSIDDEEFIRNADIASIDLDTEDGRNKLDSIIESISREVTNIDNRIAVKEQEIEIFNDHIQLVEFENQQMSRDLNNRQEYINNFPQTVKDEIEAEKNRLHEDAVAKFNGDRSKAREYKQRWKRFEEKRTVKLGVHTRPDGSAVQYEYETLEYADPNEKRQDLEFMQVETWEDRRKRTALADVLLGNETDPDKRARAIAEAYGDNRIERLEQELLDIRNGTGAYYGSAPDPRMINDMARELEEVKSRLLLQYVRDKDYVEHYNSAHFDVKDTVALALTGGSAMRARASQGNKNLTIRDGVQALFRWTPYDAKADGKRHVIRTTISNVAGIVSMPYRALKVGIGAGLAGVVALGGKISGTYNMPTPYNVGYMARREARAEYYRNNGSTRIGAWFKSLFNLKVNDGNGNRIKLNDKLICDRCLMIDQSVEDKYIRYARGKLIADQTDALRNKKAREAAFRNMARTSELYEDIYNNDPERLITDDTKLKDIESKIIQKAALSMGGKNKPAMSDLSDSFVKDGVPRQGRFRTINPPEHVKDLKYDMVDPSRNLTNGYDFNGIKGEALWTNAASRENVQRANTRGMDTALRIGSAVTLPLFKGWLSRWAIKHKNPDKTIIDGIDQGQRPEIKGQRPIIEDRWNTITTQEEVPVSVDNLTFGDIKRGDTAYFTANLDKYVGPTVKFTPEANQIQAFHVAFTDPTTGKAFDWSISPKSYENFIDANNLNRFSTEYSEGLSFNASDNVLDKLVSVMPKETGEAYRRFIENSGIDGFKQSTQFAYGVPTSAPATMGQGWSDTLIENVTKTITHTTEKKVPTIVGYEDYTAKVSGPLQAVIKKHIEKGDYVETVGGDIVVGAICGGADILNQSLSPVFKRGQKNTKNYYAHYDDGSKKMKNGIANYDMYTSPLEPVRDENGNVVKSNGRVVYKPVAYEYEKSQNDRTLDTIDGDGDPILRRDSNGRPRARDFDDDDFVL